MWLSDWAVFEASYLLGTLVTALVIWLMEGRK